MKKRDAELKHGVPLGGVPRGKRKLKRNQVNDREILGLEGTTKILYTIEGFGNINYPLAATN